MTVDEGKAALETILRGYDRFGGRYNSVNSDIACRADASDGEREDWQSRSGTSSIRQVAPVSTLSHLPSVPSTPCDRVWPCLLVYSTPGVSFGLPAVSLLGEMAERPKAPD